MLLLSSLNFFFLSYASTPSRTLFFQVAALHFQLIEHKLVLPCPEMYGERSSRDNTARGELLFAFGIFLLVRQTASHCRVERSVGKNLPGVATARSHITPRLANSSKEG